MARRHPRLEVWLRGRHVASLTEPSPFRYRLEFTEEALDEFGPGARVLSLSLPVTEDPTADHRTDPMRRPVSAFLEGLLPEGGLRSQLASTLGVASVDKMALLDQVGGECAGAVQFLRPGVSPTSGTVRPLSTDEVIQIVTDVPTHHLPEGAAPQASLAGIQDKVLLSCLADGHWGWPTEGAPSSHIIKPEPGAGSALEHLVQAEHWAMQVAAEAGMRAAATALEVFGERLAIVVTRYDRDLDGGRLHQEDFCQALSLDPQAKYEAPAERRRGGTRLRRLVDMASPRALDPDLFRRELLSLVAYNVVIGNGDAHSKNYSLLLGPRGEVSLAPLYDAAPVMLLSPRFRNTGHVINGRTHIDRVTLDDLVEEAASWGLAPTRAKKTLEETIERTWDAAHAVPLPEGTDHVLPRLEELWKRRSWRPAG